MTSMTSDQSLQHTPTILETAQSVVDGARSQAYGGPEDNFDQIAQYWSTYLQSKFGAVDRTGAPIKLNGEDPGYMMILMKVARAHNSYKQDNLVDIAGYAYCIEKVHIRLNPVFAFKVTTKITVPEPSSVNF